MPGTSVEGPVDGGVEARLAERYGRRPRRAPRRALVVAALVAVVVATAVWLVWAAVGVSRSTLTWRDGGADASDPSAVRVTFSLTAAAGSRAVCTVRATDRAGTVVGWLDVPVVTPASGRALLTVSVPTSQPANGGGVVSCARRDA